MMCLVIIKHILMKIKHSTSNENLDARCISRFFLDLGLSELVSNLWGCDLWAEELLIFLRTRLLKIKVFIRRTFSFCKFVVIFY